MRSRHVVEAFPELKKMMLAGGVAVVVLLIPLLVVPGESQADPPVMELVSVPPLVDVPWKPLSGEAPLLSAPTFPGAQYVVNQSYVHDTQTTVHFNLAFYVREVQGAELINQTTSLLGGEDDKRVLAEKSRIVTVDDQLLEIHESVIRSSSRGTRLVWHWYWVEGQFTSNPFWAKLLQANAKLWGKTKGAATIIISTGLSELQKDSVNTLQDFLRHVSIVKTLETLSE